MAMALAIKEDIYNHALQLDLEVDETREPLRTVRVAQDRSQEDEARAEWSFDEHRTSRDQMWLKILVNEVSVLMPILLIDGISSCDHASVVCLLERIPNVLLDRIKQKLGLWYCCLHFGKSPIWPFVGIYHPIQYTWNDQNMLLLQLLNCYYSRWLFISESMYFPKWKKKSF